MAMDDELDALLQLADEVDSPCQPVEPSPADDDPLLSLTDAICTDQPPLATAEPSAHSATPSVQQGSRVTLCRTRAFSAATPGSRPAAAAAASGRLNGMTTATQQARSQHEEQHFVEKLTGLKIKLPRVSGVVLKERYRSVTCVPVSKADTHLPSDGSSSWVVIGVLVSKQVGTTSKGAPYSRWRVSDLAGHDAHIAVFGEAHKEHYAEAEGSVLAFYNPKFSQKGPGGSSTSSNGLAVSQAAQVEQLATSAGWGFCRGVTKTGARCSNAVDTTISHFCQYHALQQAKTLRAPIKAQTKQQQQAGTVAEAPLQPAASNGKVFDARSKTWATVSRPAAAAVSGGRPGNGAGSSLGVTTNRSSSSTSSGSNQRPTGMHISGGGSGAGGASAGGSSSSSRGVVLGGSAAAGGGGGARHGVSSDRARAKTSADQAELRESLKAKLQQQQGGQHQQRSTTGSHRQAATGQQQPASAAAGRGFNLMAVMDAVSAGAQPEQEQNLQQQQQDSHKQHLVLQQQPQQQEPGQHRGNQATDRQQAPGHTAAQLQSQRHQQRQQQPTLLQDPQAEQADKQQQLEQQHLQQLQAGQQQSHQQQEQLQQQQQDGLDDLMDELFEDTDVEESEGLIIQPAAGGGAAAAAAGAEAAAADTQAQDSWQQQRDAAEVRAEPDSLCSAAARASAAMARLSANRPMGAGSNSSTGGVGGTTAAKLADAKKRMKVALGLAPKASLSSGGGGKKGPGGSGAKAAAGPGAGGKAAAGSRPHVSRIGAVGAASVGAAAGPARGSSSSSSGGALGAGRPSAAAAGPRPPAGTAGGGNGGQISSTGGPGGKTASGFRAMFGRVLQRTDINKPDAKLLGAVSDAAHASMMSKLLDQYEQKDNLATQLEGITKLEATAFECRTCKFLTEKRRAACVSHDVVAVRVTKRWWVCEACGFKLHTLRELMPSKRCPKCRDPEKLFRPTSAYNAPKPMLVNAESANNPVACREAMLPRGHEHAFCLNSLQD